ncbi:MAG: uroporphyrinogen decarboxylase, partial [Nitrospira sp.]|nr:uroporphyrinogen decarboxylase [Nitrospira sp.]
AFTLVGYAVGGGRSRTYLLAKLMMYCEPRAWHLLMDKFARVITGYLRQQIKAGAQAIQLFDSWVGCLSVGDYVEYVLPHVQLIFEGLKREGVPMIHFGTGTSAMLRQMRQAGGDVIGVDWRIPLDEAWEIVGHDVAVQGNLDPLTLYAPLPEIERRVEDILRRAGGRSGHIFNLGHGILPTTPIEHVAAAIDMVHRLSKK